MAGNSFGQALRITTAGESHGPANVVIVDGCPPGLELAATDLIPDLMRRRPGQSRIVTQRAEQDAPEILSGVFEGRTTGTPIAILIRNSDHGVATTRISRTSIVPGMADYSYDQKYGFRDYRGGGRASARETVSRVAAGAIARKLIATAFGGQVLGYVSRVGDITAEVPDVSAVTFEQVEHLADGQPNMVRCPDHRAAAEMVQLIEAVRKDQDSHRRCRRNRRHELTGGPGEPVFDKLKADLGKALFSLPAVMAVEYGAGVNAARARGSEFNDTFIKAGRITTESNRHGGMLGGISSGLPLVVRATVKPTSSLPREQRTVTRDGKPTTIRTKAATIRACCRASFPSPKPWCCWCLPTTGCVGWGRAARYPDPDNRFGITPGQASAAAEAGRTR